MKAIDEPLWDEQVPSLRLMDTSVRLSDDPHKRMAWLEAEASKTVRKDKGESYWVNRRSHYVLVGDMD